jgi:ribose-phosphate pyrophosphokinase
MADKLGLDFALIHRKRVRPNVNESEERMELLVGNVKGKTAILVDDMIDTGTTISLASNLLKEAGAEKIYVLISHGNPTIVFVTRSHLITCVPGIFSESEVDKLLALPIENFVITNTIPQAANEKRANGRISILDVSPTLAESIRRSHNGESINILFESF